MTSQYLVSAETNGPMNTSPNTPKCPKITCVSRASVALVRQCASVVFLTGAPLKSMPCDDLRQCVSPFLRQCEMCRQKLFKINNLERLRQCVSRPIYIIYIWRTDAPDILYIYMCGAIFEVVA
jgi:hypothetical protein